MAFAHSANLGWADPELVEIDTAPWPTDVLVAIGFAKSEAPQNQASLPLVDAGILAITRASEDLLSYDHGKPMPIAAVLCVTRARDVRDAMQLSVSGRQIFELVTILKAVEARTAAGVGDSRAAEKVVGVGRVFAVCVPSHGGGPFSFPLFLQVDAWDKSSTSSPAVEISSSKLTPVRTPWGLARMTTEHARTDQRGRVRLALVTALSAALVSFVGCSGDDDGNGPGGAATPTVSSADIDTLSKTLSEGTEDQIGAIVGAPDGVELDPELLTYLRAADLTFDPDTLTYPSPGVAEVNATTSTDGRNSDWVVVLRQVDGQWLIEQTREAQ